MAVTTGPVCYYDPNKIDILEVSIPQLLVRACVSQSEYVNNEAAAKRKIVRLINGGYLSNNYLICIDRYKLSLEEWCNETDLLFLQWCAQKDQNTSTARTATCL